MKRPTGKPRKPRDLHLNGSLAARVNAFDEAEVHGRYWYGQEVKRLHSWFSRYLAWAEAREGEKRG